MIPRTLCMQIFVFLDFQNILLFQIFVFIPQQMCTKQVYKYKLTVPLLRFCSHVKYILESYKFFKGFK